MPEFAPYLDAWRARRARDRELDTLAQDDAMARARRLACVLAQRFGVRRVVLVGSLARGEFRRGSDIDLAAEGIPEDRFFEAGAAIESEARGIEVDLVPLESAKPLFRERVLREGIVLHGDTALRTRSICASRSDDPG